MYLIYVWCIKYLSFSFSLSLFEIPIHLLFHKENMERKKQFNRYALSIWDGYINKKVIVLRAPGGNTSSPSNRYCEFTPWRACIDAKMYNSTPLDEEAPQLSSSTLKITRGVFYECETSSRNFYKVPRRSCHFALLFSACVLKIFTLPIFISLREFLIYVCRLYIIMYGKNLASKIKNRRASCVI